MCGTLRKIALARMRSMGEEVSERVEVPCPTSSFSGQARVAWEVCVVLPASGNSPVVIGRRPFSDVIIQLPATRF